MNLAIIPPIFFSVVIKPPVVVYIFQFPKLSFPLHSDSYETLERLGRLEIIHHLSCLTLTRVCISQTSCYLIIFIMSYTLIQKRDLSFHYVNNVTQNDCFYAQDICCRHSFTSHIHLGKGGTSNQGLKPLYSWVPKEVPYSQSRMRKCLSILSICFLSSNKYHYTSSFPNQIHANKSKFLLKY